MNVLGSVSGGWRNGIALGKDKTRLVNPQIPNHSEHMLQLTCICGVESPVYRVTPLTENRERNTRCKGLQRQRQTAKIPHVYELDTSVTFGYWEAQDRKKL